MHATIPSNYLRALARIMPKSDVRYYLCGVSIEMNATDAFAVATDGHMLLACKLDRSECSEFEGTGSFIIPADTLEAMKLTGKARPIVASTILGSQLEKEGKLELLTITDGATSTVCEPVDGKFPEWRRIVPDKVSGETGNYNPFYLATLQTAFNDITDRSARATNKMIALNHNGLGAAVMVGGDALAVIMPIRMDSSDYTAALKGWRLFSEPAAIAA